MNSSAPALVPKILHLRWQSWAKGAEKPVVILWFREREVRHEGKSDLYSIICPLLSKYFTEDRFIAHIQDHFRLVKVVASHSQACSPHTFFYWCDYSNTKQAPLFATLLPISTATNQIIIFIKTHPSVTSKALQSQPTLRVQETDGQRIWI